MYLDIDSESFSPKHFVIANFYRKVVCFVWAEDEFICFPYVYKKTTDKLNVLKAPAKIKDIRNFGERVFILCEPQGIHKLTENFEFAILSSTAVELGSDFCEVLTPSNGTLALKNKRLKVTRSLFPLSSADSLHTLPLNFNGTDKLLRKAILCDSYTDDVNLCIIVQDKNVYKVFDQVAQIIYTCDHSIKMIKPIQKQGKTAGAVLQTDRDVAILMQVVDDKLKYEKIFFQANVENMRVMLDVGSVNTLFFIHSDGHQTYYTKKILGKSSSQETRIEDKCYNCFAFHQSQFIIYLNNRKELIQISIDLLKAAFNEGGNDYVKLEPNMLKGLERIIDEICDKSMELKKLKEEVVQKEDAFKRINSFITKQHLKYCPKESVKRVLNQTFLESNFNKVLPKNSIVVKMLKSRGKSIYSMKQTKDCDTIVEMPICIPNLSSKLYTTTDLITYKSDGTIWCLIKNYIKDPPLSKSNRVNLSPENINFVKYKLVVLQNLIKDETVSMDALTKLKREIRQELNLDPEIFK